MNFSEQLRKASNDGTANRNAHLSYVYHDKINSEITEIKKQMLANASKGIRSFIYIKKTDLSYCDIRKEMKKSPDFKNVTIDLFTINGHKYAQFERDFTQMQLMW
jgi:hypothetical protein